MRYTQVHTGRQFMLALDHGEDLLEGLIRFCADRGIQAGYIPTFVGGLRSARLVGSCEPLADPEAPLWEEVTVESLEALGGGTLAWDTDKDCLAPHIHVAVGIKGKSAEGRVSHLLGATVQFICEIPIVEVTHPQQAPALTRLRSADLYDVPLLSFGPRS
ncbi:MULTISPECIES: PPC domain-containing DNA-binding protein [Streptomyces]|uniref:PPC domain-containing DNA-binding protein n=1 Tax=Streptomyces eurythermus TaxID=42237 RepID=A0ABW6Z3K1_9ACTN|nr:MULTISPECIES: PPC domain-containing DNA-binding protein [Streptomyces]QIS75167.1 DNA-binding protein [Streptomyces sp. DSM 40868]